MSSARAAITVLFAAGAIHAQGTGLSCWVTATAPLIRSSGLTEPVGDLVLVCTGGRPTAHGEPVPRVNLQIFLNTAVTSRLVGDAGESEATLLFDEPKSGLKGNQRLCSPGQSILGTGDGVSTYDGSGPNHCNMVRARQVKDNSLAWLGLPVDPPGNAVRTMRIKNVRANAAMLSGVGFRPVEALISVSPSASIPLVSTRVAVAFSQKALVTEFGQTVDLNLGQPGAGAGDASNYSVTVSEGFASVLRRRSPAMSSDQDTSPPPVATPDDGALYATETGLYNPAVLGEKAGLADAGTRIAVRFTGAGQGAALTVPLVVALKSGSEVTGLLRLVAVDASGSGPFRAVRTSETTLDGLPAATLSVDGDIAQAVYEALLTDPTVIETARIPIRIGQDPAGQPQAGQTSVTVMLEALSEVGSADMNSPVPRFLAAGETELAYTRSLGGCVLLFPFVTNQSDFDTGISIANTSRDPFGTELQTGSVTLNFYGSDSDGGPPPRRQVSRAVPAGETLTFTLSGGGNFGIAPVPRFQGYLIAQASFGFCHGMAFLTDLGAGRVAESYLGLVLDAKSKGLGRTSGSAESLRQ